MPDSKPKFEKKVLEDGTEVVTHVPDADETVSETKPKPVKGKGDKS